MWRILFYLILWRISQRNYLSSWQKVSLSLKWNREYIIQVFELLCFQNLKLCMTSLKHFRFWCLICPHFVWSGLLAILHKRSKNLSFRFEIFNYNLLIESLIFLLSSLQFISNGIYKKYFWTLNLLFIFCTKYFHWRCLFKWKGKLNKMWT